MDALAPLEARKARLLSCRHPAQARLLGLVQPRQHIVQALGVDGRVCGDLGADGLQFGFLLEARGADALMRCSNAVVWRSRQRQSASSRACSWAGVGRGFSL